MGSSGLSDKCLVPVYRRNTIPKGATIVHAYLQTVDNSWAAGTILKISGEDTAEPGGADKRPQSNLSFMDHRRGELDNRIQ